MKSTFDKLGTCGLVPAIFNFCIDATFARKFRNSFVPSDSNLLYEISNSRISSHNPLFDIKARKKLETPSCFFKKKNG